MATTTRRHFLQLGMGMAAGAAFPRSAGSAPPGLRPKLSKFVQPLPVPGAGIVVARPSGPQAYSFLQREIQRQLHPDLPATPVWSYDDGSGLAAQSGSFGMAVVAQRGVPLTMRFTNGLSPSY